MQIQFRQGIVQGSTSPPFLVASGTSVNLVASPTSPVIIDLAQGNSDYLFQETSNQTPAWSGLPATGLCYLYWDINLKTAIRTFGFTTLAPTFGPNAPSNPANGQMWYDTVNYSQNVYNFGAWNPVLRVFAGTYQNGTIVSQYPVGTQIGVTATVNSGFILFDDDNNPIKKYQAFNLGEFITTASPLASQFSKIQNYDLQSTVNTAIVSGNIAQYQAVCYVDDDTIGLFTSNTVIPPYGSGTPAIGIAPVNFASGSVQSFLIQGYVSDPSFNFSTVGANLFVSSSGFLTTTPPVGGTLQVMGYVVDTQTMFINPQPAIAFG